MSDSFFAGLSGFEDGASKSSPGGDDDQGLIIPSRDGCRANKVYHMGELPVLKKKELDKWASDARLPSGEKDWNAYANFDAEGIEWRAARERERLQRAISPSTFEVGWDTRVSTQVTGTFDGEEDGGMEQRLQDETFAHNDPFTKSNIPVKHMGNYIHWDNIHCIPRVAIGPKRFLEQKAWWSDDPRLQNGIEIMQAFHPHIKTELIRFLDSRARHEKWAMQLRMSQPYAHTTSKLNGDPQEKTIDALRFVDRKYFFEDTCKGLPGVDAMLRQLDCFHFSYPYVHMSSEHCALYRIPAGTKLELHSGYDNMRLNVSMGIMGCEGLFQQLGGEGEQEFKEGEVMAYLDAWDHGQEHRGEEDCWILTMGIFQPMVLLNEFIFTRAGETTDYERLLKRDRLRYKSLYEQYMRVLEGLDPEQKPSKPGGFPMKNIPSKYTLKRNTADIGRPPAMRAGILGGLSARQAY